MLLFGSPLLLAPCRIAPDVGRYLDSGNAPAILIVSRLLIDLPVSEKDLADVIVRVAVREDQLQRDR